MANSPFLSDLRKVVLGVTQDLDTPVSLAVHLLAKYREWGQLVAKSVDPSCYIDARLYARDVAAVALLKKFDGFDVDGVDPKASALETWRKCEEQCFWTNRRLAPYTDVLAHGFHATDDTCEGPILSFLGKVRKKVYDILGEAPQYIEIRFGPGGTLSDSAECCSVPHKIASDPTLTSSAHWYLPQVLDSAWGRSMCERRVNFHVVNYNRHAYVPKTAKTHRSIAIEPSINGCLQLGVARHMRRKLKRAGLDLDVAGSHHRRMAMWAARDLELATLDLSSASDTVSRELVNLLLPKSWLQHLEDLRSPCTKVQLAEDLSGALYLEKFSSMGNGYTFELETLIFLCVILVMCEEMHIEPVIGHNVSVCGDDLIMPNEVAPLTIKTLTFLGFTLNREKSFMGGHPFRESCGADYFGKQPCRPFYIKKGARLESPVGWYTVANSINALYDRLCITGRIGWLRAVERLPLMYREIRGPAFLGDVVLHDDDFDRWGLRIRNSRRYIRVVRERPIDFLRLDRFDEGVVLASALYGVSPTIETIGKQDRDVILCRDPRLHIRPGWNPFPLNYWVPQGSFGIYF